MLNAETKRHIDAARDVLVGKVPNPIAQVQEITNALIYKFMDDMDDRAVSMGGKRRFFTDKYEKFSWRNIMDSRVGAHDRLSLYTEALSQLPNNPNLPELFRSIFRKAYLPYNDSRILTLFLSEINFFDYRHQEELGDAYEYLLSIMGSQGDAGMFRTPRHIIDFMVKVVDPNKDDTVLDPACGTAGFLISAYKHVLSKHDGKDDPGKIEKPLTADEKRKLHESYRGFDIDDNMVKMAQVNLYLHGFPEPNILVHDTLSSEDFWTDRYSVIMANPPFMTPKGGIVPHNKFGVQSNRAEVLFVDYIMSHLKPNGRAGIIVPEGIIFQSTTAHKQLRKNLINDGLYAVVSLPSGVFNPYAGVKTSILFFDNNFAKQQSEILFVKISKEGYDLGAQRRALCADNNDKPEWCPKHSDFPEALEALRKWNEASKIKSSLALYVPKEKILGSGDYNLSGERYKTNGTTVPGKWPLIPLKELCIIKKGSPITQKEVSGGSVPVVAGGQKPAYFHNQANRSGKTITVSASGAYAGFVNYFIQPIFASDCSTIQINDDSKILSEYVYYLLKGKQNEIYSLQQGGGQPHVYPKDLEVFKLPLPPLEIQQQIVAELDGYQNIIAGARQVIDNWKPHIDIDPGWEKVKLGEVLIRSTGQVNPNNKTGQVLYIGLENIESGSGNIINVNKSQYSDIKSLKNIFTKGNILYGKLRPNLNKVWLADQDGVCSTDILVFSTTEKAITDFYYYFMLRDEFVKTVMNGIKGAQLPRVGFEYLQNIMIPLPSLNIQQQIVEKIESEKAIVDANKKLIVIYEQKMKDVIARLWNDKTD